MAEDNQEEILFEAEIPGEKEADINSSNLELQQKQAEAQKYKDLYLRLLADVENMKKRAVREREEYIQFAAWPLIKKILSVIDDLERALKMSGEAQSGEALYKGVEMITGSLHELIKAEGVEAIPALGKPFDPEYHQPLTVEPSSEHEENTVIEELQVGYIMKGRVIRPSLVKVSSRAD